MKVKKKWKRRILQMVLSCALICSVFQFMPCKIFASGSVSLDVTELNNDGTVKIDGKYNKHSVYSMQTPGVEIQRTFSIYHTRNADGSGFYYGAFVITSDSCKAKTTRVDDNGSTYDIDNYYLGYIQGRDGAKHYVYCLYQYIGGYYKCNANVTCTYGLTSEIWSKYKDYNLIALEFAKRLYNVSGDDLIKNAMCWESGDTDELENEATKGQINNPIEDDEEIGIPVITKRRYTTVYHDTDTGNASDGKEDIDDSQFIFDWSNKTSTGFNLKKNKYHMTRIQIKVQSKCVVYSGFSHKTVKKRFDNYGEMSSEIKSALADDTPYSIEYGTVKSMLPKTFSEKHNPLYVGRNFTFYFRVMCNESASGTGKWHCGAWRAVGLNASTTQDQTDESSNGHIDSDGNYTKDPDDGHNNSDSDSSTVDDKEDAKDQFKDDQKNGVTNGKNDSSGFEWSDLKKLVNECKEVPGLIKSIFSFLPDWVLVFVAVGFGIWIFVLIKRAIV